MKLTTLDWLIVVGTLVLAFLPAAFIARRAGRNTTEFFASGRSAPWWLIGISMVATTFAADTPNLVTDLVRQGGISGNWVWWAFLLSGMATVMFYARMWRRTGVLTDLEFYELRYSGGGARAVRAFRAIYLGLIFNVLIMATVNLAAVKIAAILLGWEAERTLLWCAALSAGFAMISGLWGVLLVDLVQFGIAMGGAVVAAWFALQQPEVAGLDSLFEKLPERTIAFLPDTADPATFITILVLPLAVHWWAVWYPGSEPGGGSYIAQRMLAARSERDSMLGSLLFNVMHYGLRTWPWIIVALSSILVFPTLDDLANRFPEVPAELIGHDIAYSAMLTLLPSGWLGLVVAGILAAYVSTMVTHLNWGSSYLVHDLYRRFVRSDASEVHYVRLSRWVTIALMALAAMVTPYINTASAGFTLILSVGAGTGPIYLLRWYWWRINATAEIVAMVVSFLAAVGFQIANAYSANIDAPTSLLGTVAITTAAWLVAAFVGPRTDAATLDNFYRLVRPSGPGWHRVREATGLASSPDSLPQALLGWALGVLFIYATMFGIGSLVADRDALAASFGAVALTSGAGLALVLRRFAQS